MKKKKVIDYRDIEDRIQPVSEIKEPVCMVIYGRPGTGKTTLAASFPTPALFIDCLEKGSESISDVKGVSVIKVKDWDDIIKVYWLIKKNPNKFKSVIIDTLSNAQNLAIMKVMEEHNKEVDRAKLGNWGTMTKQMWGQVSTLVKGIIWDFRDLPLEKVFIAHERAFTFDDDEDDDNEKIAPNIGPSLTQSTVVVLNAAVNIIGNTYIKEKITKIRDKKTKKITVKKEKLYCLRIGPNPIYATKIRKPKKIQIPDTIIDPSYEDLIDIVSGKG